MAWTYATLTQALQDYLESDETTFVADIPIIVRQAEDRILKNVQLPDFRKNSTGTCTASDQYLGIPTDFLAPYSLAVDNSGYEFLLFKEVNFIREAYPSASTEGVPKYYALLEDTYFILGPTPDSNYTVELHYFYKPESIVTASTSWLGTHAEAALFSTCLHEAYVFLKGDPDLMTKYKEMSDKDILDLKILAEGRNKTDSYRSG
jgi:hypothetical protein